MVRLLLVDDQEIIRQGIKSLLESQPDFEVVGEAENGKQAISQVEALHPDMILMDRPLAKIFCGMIMGYSDFNFWLLK